MYIWLVVSTPLKNMKVSRDDYSQSMKSHKIHVPNHQPDIYIYVYDGNMVYGLWSPKMPWESQRNGNPSQVMD